jgi:pimeloyl-ACP methyl ester carboxylesterase
MVRSTYACEFGPLGVVLASYGAMESGMKWTSGRVGSWAVAAVLVLLLAGAASVWAPDRPVDELKARWAPAPSQFIAVDGMQVHLRDEGPRDDPHPIVLLHGTSASLHTWNAWADALKSTRRVLRMDMPGFGLTGPNPSGDYSLLSYVAFVDHVLGQLGVDHAVVAGNSLGGEIAWLLALHHPERVERLVLVDAGGYPFEPEGMPIGFKLARIPALQPLTTRLLPRQTIEDSVKSVYGHPERVTNELIDRYYELTLREGNRASLIQRFVQSPIGHFADQVSKVTQPTLVLWGGQDHLIPPANAQRFAQDIAGSQVVVFDDLGHVPQEEDPARTLAAAREFMSP